MTNANTNDIYSFSKND